MVLEDEVAVSFERYPSCEALVPDFQPGCVSNCSKFTALIGFVLEN